MSHKILGIDYGSKRVGVALGDTETKLAVPLATLDVSKTLITGICAMVKEKNIEHVVVGLPRNLSGEDTPQTGLAREFMAILETSLDIPVTAQDEAGTSELVAERLGKKVKDKGDIDREAAAIILQDYLDSL